jgi:ribosomal protein S25
MTNKMTYVQAIDIALEVVTNEEAHDRLEALKASLAKRNVSRSGKPTKTQVANESVKNAIADYLANGEAHTATEIGEAVGISNQKASALLRQMKENGLVDKYSDKRVTYFKATNC